MKFGRQAALFFAAILFSVILTSCAKKQTEPIMKQGILLNTFVSVTIYDSEDTQLLEKCFELLNDYENMLSRTRENSEIYLLNDKKTAIVSDETLNLIKEGIRYGELSNGAFDITIEPLSSLWNFSSDIPKVPLKEDVANAVKAISFMNIDIKGNTITLADNAGIDLGAIAKGYIADRMGDYLKSQGVKSAIINLGGNVLCIGKKPNGEPFKVGLRKPQLAANDTVATILADNLSVVTSGIYERCFEENGKQYHHILNPKTGYPYETDLVSVTILSEKSVDGDGLSTTCITLGLYKAKELINNLDGIHAIFITDDGKIHYSDNIENFVKIIEE